MTIAQLESDLGTKKRAVKALLDKTMRACQEHVVKAATATEPAITGRLMTDDEKGAIQALQAECLDLQSRIQRAQGDAAMIAAVQQLAGDAATLRADGRRPRQTIGQQFASDPNVQAFFKNGGHRRGAWTSPAIEAAHWSQTIAATILDESAGSGGALVLPDYQAGLVGLPMRRPVVGDLPAPGTTTSNQISFMKETAFTNAAAAVAEGAVKPESALVFAAATAPVRKLAHWIPVTEEVLEDGPAVASIIDARLRWGIEIEEEDQLLNGSGVAPNLLGFNNLPGLAPAVVKDPAQTVADAILEQITQIAVNSLIMPDGFVMNPADWFSVQIAKNAQGNYLGAGPWAAPQTPMLWGLSGVITPAQVAAQALVGGFRSSSQIFRRSGITVEASNSHADFFIKNLVAVRAEERLALAVYREGAFGKVTDLTSVAP